MKPEQKIELIKRNCAEILGEEHISELLHKRHPVTYCGYETSGPIHLGHLVGMTKLLDLQKAGFHVKVLFADWHTWLNRKGDWDFIHQTTKTWEKGFKASGLDKSEFILGSSFQRKIEYIDDVMTLAQKTTMNRALRSMQQVARDIDNAHVSQVIYPLMQITDIKHLEIDLVEAGIEQRKIHALGIEILKDINYNTPVFVHTPLIPSLTGKGKMSSSDPTSFITIYDSSDDVKKKMNKAYCLEGVAEDNPVLVISRLVIFPRIETLRISRPEKFGGDLEYENYEQLEKDFVDKKLHPADLKKSVGIELENVIAPIREKFEK